MADGQILGARVFVRGECAEVGSSLAGLGCRGLREGRRREGRAGERRVRLTHRPQEQQKQLANLSRRRLVGCGGGGGGEKRRRSTSIMSAANAIGNSAACGSNCDRRFQSYAIPAENWRAKKVGGQTFDCGRGGSEIPLSNGSAGHVLHEMPFQAADGVASETKAARWEECAHSLRPRRIILVRHGQSEGNVDEAAYTMIPDSKISLTNEGWKQAIQCGKKIREIIQQDEGDDWKVYFYVSPYRRTLQTLRGIGLAFERERIAGVREEPRIREQDFGNFQDREKMRVEKEVRLRYGRFFYRFPNGESAADVYDRITGFRETLRADVDVGRFQRPESRSKNMNLVLVSHGLTLRVFLMRWYKWTVQQFEGLWNFGNTGMMVMELGPGGRYSLTMHHSKADLKAFGMTDDMIADQDWQKHAKPGELNYDWLTSGSSFFTHFDDLQNGAHCSEIPPEIMRSVLRDGDLRPEPPVVE